MKINVGDKYRLIGDDYQYGMTTDGIRIMIEPYKEVTKVKDTLFDHLFFRSMWRINGTCWIVNIDQSIIDRYFEKLY